MNVKIQVVLQILIKLISEKHWLFYQCFIQELDSYILMDETMATY